MSIKRLLFMCVLIATVAYYCVQKASVEPSTIYHDSIFDEFTKPIILWDIHDVIVKRDKNFLELVCALLCFPHKRDIMWQSSFALCKDMARELYYLFKSQSTGEVFANVALKHNNNALADLITMLANKQRVIPETAAIIRVLNQREYVQHIGSNIGFRTFRSLINKPDMQSLFGSDAAIFDIDASQFGHYDLDNRAATIAKPYLVFYQTYLAKNKIDPKRVVFIDDKEENVKAARESGLYAIRFDNPKQLNNDLFSLVGGERLYQEQLHEGGRDIDRAMVP